MKKSLSIAVAAAVLAGCASHEHHTRRLGDQLHSTPLVTAPFGYGIVSVSPEPIVLNLRVKEPKVTWSAPEGFTFSTDQKTRGIEILGLVVDAKGEPVNLRTNPNALKDASPNVREGSSSHFRCDVAERQATCVPGVGLVKNGVYRYVIRLRDKAGNLIVGDPHVVPAE